MTDEHRNVNAWREVPPNKRTPGPHDYVPNGPMPKGWTSWGAVWEGGADAQEAWLRKNSQIEDRVIAWDVPVPIAEKWHHNCDATSEPQTLPVGVVCWCGESWQGGGS